jgi:hypothetical protein
MAKGKEILHEIIVRVIGFLIFLVLLGLVNILKYYIKNEIFGSVVNFLNANIWLIIIFCIIFLIAEIFYYLIFPLNIPGPLFNAVGGALLIEFAFKLLIFITNLSNVVLNIPLDFIERVVIIIVFIVVLVIGFVRIVLDATRPKKRMEHKERHGFKEKKKRHDDSNDD